MVKIREAIVVEGRYDKNTLSQIVDAPIFETGGFQIFKDKQQMALLRKVAQVRGLIVFTDSDGAGFVIRNHLKSAINGMSREIILEALLKAGATVEGLDSPEVNPVTKQDLMELGLSGGPDSSRKRMLLLKKLELPEHMSANAMLQALSLLYDRESLEAIVMDMEQENG